MLGELSKREFANAMLGKPNNREDKRLGRGRKIKALRLIEFSGGARALVDADTLELALLHAKIGACLNNFSIILQATQESLGVSIPVRNEYQYDLLRPLLTVVLNCKKFNQDRQGISAQNLAKAINLSNRELRGVAKFARALTEMADDIMKQKISINMKRLRDDIENSKLSAELQIEQKEQINTLLSMGAEVNPKLTELIS